MLRRCSRVAVAGLAGAAAVVLLVYAVGTAATTLEHWGDSPRAVYAVVADVGLVLGVVCLSVVARELRRVVRWRQLVARSELVLYLVAAVTVGVPLAISATNSH